MFCMNPVLEHNKLADVADTVTKFGAHDDLETVS